jgi:hypothetical protein
VKVLRFVLMAATILFCATPNQSEARQMVVLSYQEMLEKSDLVVIATPKQPIQKNRRSFQVSGCEIKTESKATSSRSG